MPSAYQIGYERFKRISCGPHRGFPRLPAAISVMPCQADFHVVAREVWVAATAYDTPRRRPRRQPLLVGTARQG